MKYIVPLLFFIFYPLNSYAQGLLEKYCSEMGGSVVNDFTCPKSGLHLKWKFCLINNPADILFYDGCTGPSGGFAAKLYPACIKHDYCYHHEPSTNGLSQKDCDQQFLRSAIDLCSTSADQKKCRDWARAMYRAVRGFGKLAYNCADYPAEY